jgi:hypothetical protein
MRNCARQRLGRLFLVELVEIVLRHPVVAMQPDDEAGDREAVADGNLALVVRVEQRENTKVIALVFLTTGHDRIS